MDELLDLMSKEEYLENEEKIQKALEKSKEEREQRQQEKLQSKAAESSSDVEPSIEKADDKKHILDAEKTLTFEPTVSPFLIFTFISLNNISVILFHRAKKVYKKRLVIWIYPKNQPKIQKNLVCKIVDRIHLI